MMRRLETAPIPRRHSRRGFTLVGVLVSVTLTSILLGVAVLLIHTLLRTERATIQAAGHGGSLLRVSDLFPRDVRGAVSAEIAANSDGAAERLDLKLPEGRTIRYDAQANVLERVAETPGAPAHRDQFHFPPGTTIRFQREREPDRIRMLIARPSNPYAVETPPNSDRGRSQATSGTPRTVAIEAALGRDHRFEIPSQRISTGTE